MLIHKLLYLEVSSFHEVGVEVFTVTTSNYRDSKLSMPIVLNFEIPFIG